MIDAVVAPLLHNKAPLKDPAVSTELPQLFTTVTVGVGGIGLAIQVDVLTELKLPV